MTRDDAPDHDDLADATPAHRIDNLPAQSQEKPPFDDEAAEGFGLALLLGEAPWAGNQPTRRRESTPPRPAARSCPDCGAAVAPVFSPLRREWVFGPCRVCQARRDREECNAAQRQALEERQMRHRTGLLAQSGLRGRFARRTFAAFRVEYQPLAYEAVLRYATSKARLLRLLLDPAAPALTPEDEDERGQSLIMSGESGTGKTHLAAAIVHYLCEAGVPALFISASELLLALRATFGEGTPLAADAGSADGWRDAAGPALSLGTEGGPGRDRELDLYAHLWQVPLLALDDVDKVNSRSGWHREVLYTVINRRYELLLPTVVTTNLGRVALGEAIGRATVSRLLESGLFIAMQRGDYRLNRLTVLGEEREI